LLFPNCLINSFPIAKVYFGSIYRPVPEPTTYTASHNQAGNSRLSSSIRLPFPILACDFPAEATPSSNAFGNPATTAGVELVLRSIRHLAYGRRISGVEEFSSCPSQLKQLKDGLAVAEGDGKNSPGAELLAKERGRSL